jgi:hypothetical protein
VNFANANAAGILSLLGLDPGDLYGAVDHGDLAALRRRLVKALNDPDSRAHLVVDGYELKPGHAGVAVVEDEDGVARIERRGCRAIVGGNTDEQTLRRLRELLLVVVWAQEHGCGVAWS